MNGKRNGISSYATWVGNSTFLRIEPVKQAAYFMVHGRRDAAHTGHVVSFCASQSGAAGKEYLHGASYQGQRHRQQPSSSKSIRHVPGCHHPRSRLGVLAGLRVQLLNGLGVPRLGRPRCRCQRPSYPDRIATHEPQASFTLLGRARPMDDY